MKKPIMERYTLERFKSEAHTILALAKQASSVEDTIRILYAHVSDRQYEQYVGGASSLETLLSVIRDCARVLRGILLASSAEAAGFSTAQALWDIAQGRSRPDLQPAFYAELTHLVLGLEGREELLQFDAANETTSLSDRELALQRSEELDHLWTQVAFEMARYEDGLSKESRRRRTKRRNKIQSALGATKEQFADYKPK